jgi:hypothetical protein
MIDGWNEPVSTHYWLQTAVRILARAKGNPPGRNKFSYLMDKATLALDNLLPEHFPERVRGRATKVLSLRMNVRHRYGESDSSEHYHFDWLTPRQRDAFIDDLLSLNAACLLDLGRMADYRDIFWRD